MKTLATVLVSSFVLGAALMGAAPAYAQTTVAKTCLSLTSNVGYGMQDAHTDGSISRLQDFLATQGYFDRSLMGTLRFGPATRAAVIKFQAAQNISQTGFVGPLTRAAISRISCGTTPPPNSTVSLYRLAPPNGETGTTVSVTGFGFTNSNTVLLDGSVAARNVPIISSIAIACTTSPSCHGGINQTIQFTIPTALSANCTSAKACPLYARLVTPGTYSITVQNDNGTSNALPFTVTGATSTIYTL
ncbi:MAG: hypothetical protein JWO84_247 [Parcubacteria group bacterium]|nr:hypothetical protein [Parcubacteria group bacterium]